MARILLSYNRTAEVPIKTVSCYFESVAKEFRDQGNDVLMMNTAFFNTYDSNEVRNKRLNKLILDKAIEFDPELIIAFYHKVPKCILEHFSDVPVVIWDGDHPYYFSDREYIEENIERYTIFSITKDWYEDYIEMGFAPEQYNYIPNATSVRKRDREFTMNISLLGSRAYPEMALLSGMQKRVYLPQSKAAVEERLRTGNEDVEYYLEKYFRQQRDIRDWEENKLYPLFDYRWLVLANVMDMGLTLSGVCWHRGKWENINESMPQLLAMYDPRRVWTLEENEEFYNSSKISLSPLHPQAHGKAFPWRVFDVMASNSCLVMGSSTELAELCGKDVDIPMFKNPYDVRDICKDLLANEDRRTEIVRASQEWVDKNARWTHRFRDAEQILGIKLVDLGKEGSICDIMYDDPEIISVVLESESKKKTTIRTEKEEEPRLAVRIGNAISRAWHKWQDIGTIKKNVAIAIASMFVGIVLNMLAHGYMDAAANVIDIISKVLFGAGAVLVGIEYITLAIKVIAKVARRFLSDRRARLIKEQEEKEAMESAHEEDTHEDHEDKNEHKELSEQKMHDEQKAQGE